ncbi:acyltransferase [Agriterribacter sp.]|uniref:acyltransferase family protein n=1 Tax=Agriterribacter sp. TaxID=2821509 RepID=UPI002D17512F|nr:acyltransferase [Agriterribacter sp.]HRO44564.1 acyltransferase [Agriterribacter sp.]HRQ16001.1 acyltransferase [Agriterribacter sp.]
MKISYIRELDGVRGIAALMVMFFHFFFQLKTDDAFLLTVRKLSYFGETGVSLFFVLSGFLITRILMASRQNERFFYHFYLRRSLRIFPLYYLFLAVYYFVFPLVKHVPQEPFSMQAVYWIYMQDFAFTFNWAAEGPGHFWSLAIEEHFYLFWPLLVYYLNNKKITYVISAIIITALLTRGLLIAGNYEYRFFTFSRMDELAMGALLAVLEAKGKLKQVKQNRKRFLFLFIISAILVLLFWQSLTGTSSNLFFRLTRFLILGFAYFSFIGFVITAGQGFFIKKMLRIPPLIYTGKISYGLYVYHPICFWLARQFFKTGNIWIEAILCFAFTYIIASGSYYLFEKRFLNLKKYFEYKPGKAAGALAVQPASPANIMNREL